jgi:polysaccharide pyruvyl transferase WcaK-like protein
MNILIDNAGFVNKGAELMLRAVIKKTKEKYPNRHCVINPHTVGGKIAQPIGEGLYIYNDKSVFKYIPQKLLSKLFFVKPSEINLYLDAGGFQFSDQWIRTFSTESNRRVENYYNTLKSKGAKLVFLPQAFGPFTLPLAIERMQIVYKYADILFAREQASYDHLIKLFGESKKIILKPDFTNLLKPSVPLTQFIESNRYVCVIPNLKMLTHTSVDISSKYISFMTSLCQDLMDRGEDLILLNHEGKGDLEIIEKIQANLTSKALILTGLNALEVKAIISKMKLLISSRFHGVVSGLSQGVCTFSTGWSHKYQELLADYHVSDNLLDINDLELSKRKITEALITKESIYQTKPEVVKALELRSEEMWNIVFSL